MSGVVAPSRQAGAAPVARRRSGFCAGAPGNTVQFIALSSVSSADL